MPLNILSYNILKGGEDRLPLIASVIQKQQPDAVALLEAWSYTNVETLAQQLEMELTFGKANNGRDHIAWLSRLPVIHAENYCLPVLAKTLLKIELSWEGRQLALFATHLKAGLDQNREQHRVTEIQAILELLQPLYDQPHMLVGDLNTLHPADHPNVPAYFAASPWEGIENPPEDMLPRQAIPFLLESGYIDCYRALNPTKPG